MFTRKKISEPTALDVLIDEVQSRWFQTEPDSDDCAKLLNQLTKLYELQATNSPKTVSPDVLVSAIASLAGILAILSFEKTNVLTSKAIGFVLKLK